MAFKEVVSHRVFYNSDKPYLVIYSTGHANLNLTAQKLWLEDYRHVRLFYDPDKGIIGIKPTKDSINSYALSKSGGNHSGCGLSLRKLLEKYHIPYKVKQVLLCSWIGDEGGMICVKPNKIVAEFETVEG